MAKIMKRQEKKRKVSALHLKIMGAALVPMLIMAIVVGICAGKNIKSALREQMMVGLETGTQSLESHYHLMNDSPFSISSDGKLMKGDYNLTDETSFIDNLSEQSGLELTVFYGDTRKATTLKDSKTGERIVDTTADADIVEKVVNQGKMVEKFDLTINGKKYYACYIPLKNVDGSTIGMLFAGRSAEEEEVFIRSKISLIVVVEFIFMLIAAVVVFLITKGIQNGIFAAERAVSGLANGNLSTELDAKFVRRKDELGDMAKGVVILLQQLVEVVQSIKTSSEKLLKSGTELSQMAAQTSTTTDDISKAVEDISSGAVSQANEIETASFEIEAMGQLISRIAANAAELDAGTKEIKNTSDRSMEIVQELSLSNDRSMEAVRRIAQDVNATNESANRISTAVDLITSIAEETNLLSLNASIEAARAGEQGRGFAVVAGQIQKLAEQSNESANSIAEIIQNLLSNSENTVRVMDEVQSIMNEQQRKLDETRKQFEMVSQGISAASEAASVIRQQTDGCDSARANVVDVISNLSAISEENAASTQQTTASMQELNATISILAEEAQKLQDLSKGMEEDISFFRLAGTHVMESVHSHFDEEENSGGDAGIGVDTAHDLSDAELAGGDAGIGVDAAHDLSDAELEFEEASATFREDFPVDEEMPGHFTDSEE